MQQHIHGLLHRARASDGAAIYKEYYVGILDGVQTVRDDNARGFFRQFLQNILEQPLRHRIDVRGRLIEELSLFTNQSRVLLDTTDGEESWTTIGVSENIIEASWQALADSIVYGLLRAEIRG
jgi:riboflavin biosynthesis pyrimidine reductase